MLHPSLSSSLSWIRCRSLGRGGCGGSRHGLTMQKGSSGKKWPSTHVIFILWLCFFHSHGLTSHYSWNAHDLGCNNKWTQRPLAPAFEPSRRAPLQRTVVQSRYKQGICFGTNKIIKENTNCYSKLCYFKTKLNPITGAALYWNHAM